MWVCYSIFLAGTARIVALISQIFSFLLLHDLEFLTFAQSFLATERSAQLEHRRPCFGGTFWGFIEWSYISPTPNLICRF